MKDLLKFEFRKLFRLKSFYILAACAAAVAASPVLIRLLTAAVFGMSREYVSEYTGAIDFVASSSTGTASLMIFGLFSSLYVCGDYMANTMKNIVARGHSRIEIFAAHFIVNAAAGAIYVALSWLVSFTFSGILWGLGDGWSVQALWTFLLQVFVMCGFTAVFQLISTLIRRTGGALTICVLLPMAATSVLSIADMLLAGILKHDMPFELADSTLSALMKNVNNFGADAKTMWVTLAGAAAYLVVFLVGGAFIARSQEI